jgi:hypothetical protein
MVVFWKVVGILSICLGILILFLPTLGKEKSIVDIRMWDILWSIFLIVDGILILCFG